MKTAYDIVVIGGGPAGAWTAYHAARNGASVVILEKDRDIGIPVRCAEGVSEKGLASVIDMDPRWIAATITGARLVAPDGTAVDSYPDERGFILHRRLFDTDLAAKAVEQGAECFTKAYASGLVYEKGKLTGVNVRYMGQEKTISTQLVVGADGVESRVGRWAGLATHTPVKETMSCVQMMLGHINIDPSVIEFYFGKEVAPDGYLWVFPKGKGVANVGLGVSGAYSKNKTAYAYLSEWVANHFPGASVLATVAGCVPVCPEPETIVADGVMLVGDAARQANPITGGGIINGMIAGEIAGTVAANAVKKGKVDAKTLSAYPAKWRKGEGKNNARSYKMKQVINQFSDEELNKLAQTLLAIPETKRNAFEIFTAALKNHPKLLMEVAKVFIWK